MRFRWHEISNGIGNAPAWSLAGRTDDVTQSRGESLAALVAAASGAANTRSITSAIDRHKAGAENRMRAMFQNRQRGGVLVVAGIRRQHNGHLFSYLQPFRGVFAQPSHAYSLWSRERRMEDPDTEHRFFWATRQ